MLSNLHYRTVYLIAFDVMIIYGALIIALLARFGGSETAYHLFENNGVLKIGFLTSVSLLSIYFCDLYDYRILNVRRELLMRLVQALGITWIALAILYYLFPFLMVGRGIALYSVAITLTLLLSIRSSIHYVFGHPEIGERMLIVGDDKVVEETVQVASQRRDVGIRIAGFTTENGHVKGDHLAGVEWLGKTKDLETIVRDQKIERIVIGVKDRRGAFPAESLLRLRLAGDVVIEESTSFFERVSGKVHLDQLRPSWLIFSMKPRETRLRSLARHLLYRTVALIGIITSFPVMVITAILILLESGRPVFYSQERVGKNGKPFKLFKFRSMKTDAEADGAPVWAGKHDDRVTRVGSFIRKTRIDEIPQFWNIMKGEMSFIGPRPERPFFVAGLSEAIPFYDYRHLVAPGLTGWAQINYPYGASTEDARQKLQYDLFYIKNQNLLLDIFIMFETIKTVIIGRGGR